MNADAVQAAMAAIHDMDCDEPGCRGAEFGGRYSRWAEAAVAAVEPIIRAQIAAEIERKSHEARNEYERGLFRYGSAVEPGSRDPWAEGAIDAYLDAARIARGDS